MHLFLIFTLICTLSAQQALPYYENVPGGLHPGMAVYLNGRVLRNPYGIGVDFANANWQGANIPFHFNPRFHMDNLVLNTFQAGRWGDEQVHKMPFREGEHFKVIFVVTDAGYLILLNGKLSYIFRHRIPPQSVRLIRVDGNLELQSLKVITLPVIGNMITTSPKNCHLALPYYENVPGGLHPGMAVYLYGRVLRNPYGIGVNFANANWQGANIPLHFNPRFHMDNLVLNTFQAGRWGDEQVHKMPFREGEHFEVIFIVTDAGYLILVNRKLLYNFLHRIPPQSVRLIRVGGNLELQSLKVITAAMIGNLILVNGNPFCKYSQKPPPQGEQFIRVDGNPELQTPNVIARPKMGNTITASPEIYHQPVPYRGNIPGGLGINRTITVRGFILKNATRFEINFTAGQDIPLHINLHMKPWRAVVRNSFLNGNWGREERSFIFNPFQPGQYFKLSIHCDNREFKFYANDQPFFNYTHRYFPIKNISTMEIDGDVILFYIKY